MPASIIPWMANDLPGWRRRHELDFWGYDVAGGLDMGRWGDLRDIGEWWAGADAAGQSMVEDRAPGNAGAWCG